MSRAVRTYFSDRYPRRSSWFGKVACRRGEDERLIQLRRWLGSSAGISILDAGCGDGRFLSRLLDARPSRVRIEDFAASQLGVARERLRDCAAVFEACHVDILTVEDDHRYDLVLALGVFDYTADWPHLLQHLLMRTRGILCVDFPKAATFHSVLRRLWLGAHGIALHCATQDTVERMVKDIAGRAEIVELPLHWLVRIERGVDEHP